MASTTATYAAGDQQWRNVAKGEETVSLKGKRRKTVWLSQQPRPLFVAEAEFKAAKYFTRVKKTMLVLYGSEVLVVDVAALDAADSGSSAGDISVAVLRLISYAELLDVFVVGSTGRVLKIEYADSTDKPKLASSALVGIDTASLAATANGTSTNDPNSLSTNSATLSEAYGTAASTAGITSVGAASLRVRYDSFTLYFKDPAAAQEAAAALVFHRAQYAAVQQWLHQGLHAGFRCDPIVLKAIPLALSNSTAGFGRQTSGNVQSSSGGASSMAAAIAGQNPAGLYPWGSVSSGWGCSVALPASWGSILDSAAENIPADPADSPDISMEDMSVPLELSQGPQALQLQFTTPLGLVEATIKPQHLRAALLNQQCRQVLAIPAQKSHSAGQQSGTAAGFSWTVSGRVPEATSMDGSSSNLSGVMTSASSATSLSARATEDTVVSLMSASSPNSGLSTSHTVEVFAAVTIEVHRTPNTVGRRGAARCYNPAVSLALRNQDKVEDADIDTVSSHSNGNGVAASMEQEHNSLRPISRPTEQVHMVQLAVGVLLASLAVMQLQSQPAIAVLQSLLAAALLVSTWWAGSIHSISGRRMSSLQASHKADSSTGASAESSPTHAQDTYVDASPFENGEQHNNDEDDITCCGWSMKLTSGDVVATPTTYLQLQIAMARADKGLTQMRQRMLSITQSMSMSMGGAGPPLSAAAAGVPVLVSEPEPAWLYPDNKQRFLNAKPTLAASQEQAQRTHRWRVRMDVDNVLRKPCPGFEQISGTFPTYTLLNNSPDGHAVVMMKVGAIKDLCELVFNQPEGKGVTLAQVEQTLALFNEYLVHVAAPDILPAGFQVQVYDMEGFKLGYVNGDMITLFKILVRFGHYYPERLKQALVINAPGWFTYPWKLLSSFLDANTSAKVVVVGPAKSALSTLAHHMGGVENVPVAWGGKNPTPLDDFPDHKQMMEFARRLNAGEQPLQDCKRLSAMFAQ